ncbi:hypothetical protein M4L39_02570 [Staphylococcus equorum]|uniref:Uncharacterized protein n=1 Tax=Staphylococcus equorum TaxID=246432 RepID=A0A9X4L8M2_9STAP|nr:hypothetical protein [Staphylococcus equorum]MDG0842308.1 hypothetical protein [Staphylococcus equorum]MDG0858559.1 hypothetical protein [Staphylococcus equorum]
MKSRAEYIKVIRKVIDRHKHKQSYANISAITTISKKIQKINSEAKRATVELEKSLNTGMQLQKDYLLDDWLDYYLKTWHNDKLSQSTIEIEKGYSKSTIKNLIHS